MAEYLSISGVVKIDSSHLNGTTGVLRNIGQFGVSTEYVLKGSVALEIYKTGNGVGLRYTPNKSGNALEAEGNNLQDAEAKIRTLMALELARFSAAKEFSPSPEKIAPIGSELSDLL